ncbi:MAG: type II toxin-antitoxin system Phd/YefM family antitoxin [Alphaproteobacteria bacterium]|nr:type II toxin-antitoxin system Phd/YefM family antitoxin [Alphaproteobacteria bacterium]
MREVGVLEAKTHLSALLDAIEKDGETVTITRHGRAVARLCPASEASGPAPRRASAAELTERFQALRERIAAANPDAEGLTWEALKDDARR